MIYYIIKYLILNYITINIMASIFTPREFKNYCYVVKCEDGNEFNKNITEDKFIKMCKEAYFIIDMMEIID